MLFVILISLFIRMEDFKSVLELIPTVDVVQDNEILAQTMYEFVSARTQPLLKRATALFAVLTEYGWDPNDVIHALGRATRELTAEEIRKEFFEKDEIVHLVVLLALIKKRETSGDYKVLFEAVLESALTFKTSHFDLVPTFAAIAQG